MKSYFIRENIKYNKIIYFLLIISAIIGYILRKYINIRLHFYLDSALFFLHFYGVGYFIANNIEIMKSKLNRINTIISISILTVISIFIAYSYKGCDMNNNIYSN